MSPSTKLSDKVLGWIFLGLMGLAVLAGLADVVQGGAGALQGSLIPVGSEAPAFMSVGHAGGAPLSDEQFKGRVVVLDFWATWCGPCQEQAPVLAALEKELGAEGPLFVSANVDDPGPTLAADVDRFRTDHGAPDLKVVYPPPPVVAGWRIQSLPTLYVLGRDGKVRFRSTGFTSRSVLAREIAAAAR